MLIGDIFFNGDDEYRYYGPFGKQFDSVIAEHDDRHAIGCTCYTHVARLLLLLLCNSSSCEHGDCCRQCYRHNMFHEISRRAHIFQLLHDELSCGRPYEWSCYSALHDHQHLYRTNKLACAWSLCHRNQHECSVAWWIHLQLAGHRLWAIHQGHILTKVQCC